MKNLKIFKILIAFSLIFASCKSDFTEKDLIALEKEKEKQKLDAELALEREKNRHAIALEEKRDQLARRGGIIAYSVLVFPAENASFNAGRTQAALDGFAVTVSQNGMSTTTTTNASGVASFGDLRAGRAVVSVTKSGYTSAGVEVDLTPASSLNPGNDNSKITRSAGTRIPLFATSGASTARITGIIEGEIDLTNDDREPLSGVTVTAKIDVSGQTFTKRYIRPKLLSSATSTTAGASTADSNAYSAGRIITITYDDAIQATTTGTTGQYTLEVPSSADGLPIVIDVSDRVGNQTFYTHGTNTVQTERTVWGYNTDAPTPIDNPSSAIVIIDPPVVSSTPGVGATATAQLGGSGAITAVTVVNRGKAYTQAPTIKAVNASKNGSGFDATAHLDSSGNLASVTINNRGSDYDNAALSVLESATAATFTSAIGYELEKGVVKIYEESDVANDIKLILGTETSTDQATAAVWNQGNFIEVPGQDATLTVQATTVESKSSVVGLKIAALGDGGDGFTIAPKIKVYKNKGSVVTAEVNLTQDDLAPGGIASIEIKGSGNDISYGSTAKPVPGLNDIDVLFGSGQTIANLGAGSTGNVTTSNSGSPLEISLKPGNMGSGYGKSNVAPVVLIDKIPTGTLADNISIRVDEIDGFNLNDIRIFDARNYFPAYKTGASGAEVIQAGTVSTTPAATAGSSTNGGTGGGLKLQGYRYWYYRVAGARTPKQDVIDNAGYRKFTSSINVVKSINNDILIDLGANKLATKTNSTTFAPGSIEPVFGRTDYPGRGRITSLVVDNKSTKVTTAATRTGGNGYFNIAPGTFKIKFGSNETAKVSYKIASSGASGAGELREIEITAGGDYSSAPLAIKINKESVGGKKPFFTRAGITGLTTTALAGGAKVHLPQGFQDQTPAGFQKYPLYYKGETLPTSGIYAVLKMNRKIKKGEYLFATTPAPVKTGYESDAKQKYRFEVNGVKHTGTNPRPKLERTTSKVRAIGTVTIAGGGKWYEYGKSHVWVFKRGTNIRMASITLNHHKFFKENTGKLKVKINTPGFNYTAAPHVTVQGAVGAAGVRKLPTINSTVAGGILTGITVTDRGEYKKSAIMASPTVTARTYKTAATVKGKLNQFGFLDYITVHDVGRGYDATNPPSVSISLVDSRPSPAEIQQAPTATAVIDTDGNLVAVNIVHGGRIVNIDDSETRAIVNFSSINPIYQTARASAVVNSGVITRINIDSGGNGYTRVPGVSILPLAGTPIRAAVIRSVLINNHGTVTSISLTDGGAGYNAANRVNGTPTNGDGMKVHINGSPLTDKESQSTVNSSSGKTTIFDIYLGTGRRTR